MSAWFYLEPRTGEKKGPMPTPVILKLLERGLAGLDSTTHVWHEGMSEWKPVSQVEELMKVITFQNQQWYYLNHEHQQQGPILTRLLVHKLKEGELDGLSMVFGGGLSAWTAVAEVPELKETLQKIAQEEEALEQARLNDLQRQQEAQEVSAMTFIPDGDNQPAFPSKLGSDEDQNPIVAAQNDTTEPPVDGEEGKTFVGDDGRKYCWDEGEQSWVQSDEVVAQSTDSLSGHKRQHMDEEAGDDDDDQDDAESVASSVHSAAPASDAPSAAAPAKKKRKNKKKKRKTPATWIYISGLPGNVTSEEVHAHFSKVGLIALHPLDQQPRIRIYRDSETDECKGDGVLCYNAPESVQIAVQFLDGGYLRPNCRITVAPATFEQHTAASDSSTNKSSSSQSASAAAPSSSAPTASAAQIKVARSAMRAALSWSEDDDSGMARSTALRIVVLAGLFSPADFDDPQFEVELEEDLVSECRKFGDVEKLTIFSKHPRGIAVVKFSTGHAAQECIRVMNGRFFAGRALQCFYWDGTTDYSLQRAGGAQGAAKEHEEEEREEERRLHDFGDWLEHDQGELPEEFRLRTE